MKISIITVVFNNKDFIESCIKSIFNQTYQNIEYIIIDGVSIDGTLDAIQKYKDKITKILSEPDFGIYDALNKGIKLASGDVVGLLHSDDFYAHDKVLQKLALVFEKHNVDSCYVDF